MLPFLSSLLLGTGCAPKQVEVQPPCPEPAVAPPPVATMVDPKGGYPTIPLEKDIVTLAVIQNDVTPMSTPEAAQDTIAANLAHVSDMIRQACAAEKKPDILLLHEFPLTGYLPGNRDNKLQMTIEIPGKETETLSALAKECDSYLVFGAYARDAEWPRHILSLNTVINRQGEIVKAVWKPRNIKRFYPTFEITTTTIESVYDKFIEQYGADDVFPVIQTEFGNLAVSTVQLDPFVFTAFAMKGTEIMLRTSTLFFENDVTYTAMVNNVYTAMANIPHESKYGGRSMVVDPNGTVMGQLPGQEEGILSIDIPIAELRAERSLPQYALQITTPILDQFVEEIPLNHMDIPSDTLPIDGKEMKSLLDETSRWLPSEAGH